MNHSTKPIQVYRGDYVESTHDVHIAIVKPNGELVSYYGDTNRLTFARSSMKPFQAVPVVESGAMEAFDFTERELSLFCASHSGEPIHRESVAAVLQKLHLEESHLQCGTHVPRDMDSYNQLIRSGGELTPFYSNCSGKHAGMLAGCVQQQMDVETYRELTHPYQQQIIDVIANVSSFASDEIKTSVDGCGVPVHRVPLFHMALAFSRLASPDKWSEGDKQRRNALKRIRKAMSTYPEMVAGTNRFDSDLMNVFDGRIVAKGGAEGVHCFGDKETGLGVAIKVDDGNARGTNVAAMEVLKQLKVGNSAIWEQLDHYHNAPVLNARKEKIGAIRAHFTLNNVRQRGILNEAITVH
ncbi:asparaginase [Ornithinibacillus salinisoli]|uniref:Asparaginase n=1 Tax=Ornithinibacillus salinisoli TaxID=1848459 RepID=A0ABW4W011_9BACI